MKIKDSPHPYAIITILFWSMAFAFTRLSLTYFSAFSLGFLRYAIASLTLLLIVLVMKLKLPKLSDLKWFLLSGATGFFLYMITFNKGCETVSSATSSVIIATTPIITALFARIFYQERLKKLQWVAILICFGGVIVLTVLEGGITVNVGILWLLGAAVLISLYNLLQRRLTKRYTAVQSTAFSIFAGTLLLSVFLPEAVSEVAAAPPVQLVYILFLGIFPSAIAYISWAKAFAKAAHTSSVSNYMFVTPLLASMFGVVIGKEAIDLSAIVGGIIIILGLLLFNFGDRLKPKKQYIRIITDKDKRKLGKEIGAGNTATVYEWEEGKVLKLFRKDYPQDSVEKEMRNAMAIRDLPFPKPKAYELIRLDDRLGIVYDRIDGESLLDWLYRTGDMEQCTAYMVELQKMMLNVESDQVPDYKDTLNHHLMEISDIELREKALKALEDLPEGNTLCHGDLYPGNILLKDGSCAVIDFMNICRGPYLYDVARTVFLLQYTPVYEEGEIGEQIRQFKKSLADLYLMQMQVTRDMIEDYLFVIKEARKGECPEEYYA